MITSVRVTLSLDKESRKLLYDLSQEEHRTMSQIVRDALVAYENNRIIPKEQK